MKEQICRRAFLSGAGAGIVHSIGAPAFARLNETSSIFASAIKSTENDYQIVLFDENGHIVKRFELPTRGHDIAFNPTKTIGVAFARRPGIFALVFDIYSNNKPQLINAKAGRHFYGHGVFSADGKYLYASENDFHNGVGKIGIYDVINKFRRVGEYESFGVGPHEILLSPDGKNLIVANGGIKTHPNYGRAKLNIPSMKPSLCFIDRASGKLIEKHQLASTHFQSSIRHLAVGGDGQVYFGCQHQGDQKQTPPLIGSCSIGVGIELWERPSNEIALLKNYIGSVAISKNGEHVAVSSPKGGVVNVYSSRSHKLLTQYNLGSGCGIAPDRSNFIVSSQAGGVGGLGAEMTNTNLKFDNHIAVR